MFGRKKATNKAGAKNTEASAEATSTKSCAGRGSKGCAGGKRTSSTKSCK